MFEGTLDIATSGISSHGVQAQSIGGGGGSAGFAATGAVGVGFPAVAVGVGGAGGSGGDVTIDTVDSSYTGAPGAVSTKGDASNGLFAQSVGGGGGSGGTAVTADLTVSGAGPSARPAPRALLQGALPRLRTWHQART